MPDEISVVLPTTKPNFTGAKIVGVLIGVSGLMITGVAVRDAWVFNHMTAGEHLWEAEVAMQRPPNLDLALQHLNAIPPSSAEAIKGTPFEKEVRRLESDRKIAEYDKMISKASAIRFRKDAVRDLSTDLKNLGYDLSVEASSDVPSELVITASEFSDTDHRVRFLSFLRSANAPLAGVCLGDFEKVRLRSSKIPLMGFNETYPLKCSR